MIYFIIDYQIKIKTINMRAFNLLTYSLIYTHMIYFIIGYQIKIKAINMRAFNPLTYLVVL